jgi:signal transduction histidine kinase
LSGRGLFYVRSTRLVASGRAVLATFLAVGVMFGSLAPSLGDGLVRPLIASYLAYSLILFGISRSRRYGYRVLRQPLLPAAIDVGVFTLLLYMTTGAESPFFSPLAYLIVSATIQWGSRGALTMSLVTVAICLPAGAWAVLGAGGDASGALTSIVRLGYILVLTVLLVGFGRHFERMIAELSRMSDPLDADFVETEPPTAEALQHALSLFRARRGVVLWAEDDEPYLHMVEIDGEARAKRVLPPGGDDWLVSPGLEGSVFLYDRGSDLSITQPDNRAGQVVRGAPIAPSVLATLTFERMLVIPLRAEPLQGVVLVLDQEEPAAEDLAFGAMVSAQFSAALHRWQAQMTHRATVTAAERVRLARDLHDGVLQFLAGAAMQLEGLLRAGNLPVAAKVRLMGLRQALSDEQRELRAFITAVRPARPNEAPLALDLSDELEELADHLSRYWNICVLADVAPDLKASTQTAYDIGRIVREAVANAARHGRAKNVTVTARAADGLLTLEIADDGQGFPFQGEMQDEELKIAGVGPRSLQERARSMGGRVRLHSGPKGARLGIELPLERMAA